MDGLPSKVFELLTRFEASSILLVHWEIDLLKHLGCPLVSNEDLFFLIPDDQLQTARDITTELGFHPADKQQLKPVYASEFCDLGSRYIINEHDSGELRYGPRQQRLVLLPLSWTGIDRHELAPTSACDIKLPCTVWTVPISVACTAFLRLAAREKRGSFARTNIIDGLASVIAYAFFNMSYEGDYMEFPEDAEPLSGRELSELDNAVREIQSWEFRPDEEWMKKAMIEVVSGKARYEDLPHC
ncbi:hypothetical protein AK830_g10287 [Neonectria ditissima]|uniref:Uncharacterized protein n=1 Tax=Neonectria ditissima TaxID=78410 RepID=A0A0P7B419_9HYPO|nr:hypothetical protein AK830_g10287 [Neonectria ditissima]